MMQTEMTKTGRSLTPAQPWLRVLLVVLFMLAAGSVVSHAQAYYGTIVGNVTDQTGAAVVGAKVTASSAATSTSFTTTTSHIGGY